MRDVTDYTTVALIVVRDFEPKRTLQKLQEIVYMVCLSGCISFLRHTYGERMYGVTDYMVLVFIGVSLRVCSRP